MNEMMDFIMSALPWLGLGLWVVTATVQQANSNKGKKTPAALKILGFVPAVLFFLLAALQKQAGQAQSASTNTVLAIFILVYALYADVKETHRNKK